MGEAKRRKAQGQYLTENGREPDPAEISPLVALFNAGRFAEMADCARALVARHPTWGLAWKALAASLQVDDEERLRVAQMAAQLLSDDVEAHYNLGSILQNLGRLDAAMASYGHALAINPQFFAAYNNLGAILKRLGRIDESAANYRRALALQPNLAEAHGNLGAALLELRQPTDAVASCRRAIALKPAFAEAHSSLGNALKYMGQLDAAAVSYRRALAIKPDYAEAHSNLLLLHNYLGDQPPAILLHEAQQYNQIVTSNACRRTAWRNEPDPARCLRVGLVSADLRAHPVGYFLESVLLALSAQAAGRLELFAYANQPRVDAVTERIKACCRGWRTAVGLADDALAQQISDDGIDILIDLSGHTALNRLPVFARKPAPVQASWLGYFATTGVAAIDYLIADPWTIPEQEEIFFTEKIWRLPETRLCFTAPGDNVAVSPLPALTNGHVSFGCFNNLTKMNDAVVALWSRVLVSVPGSRIVLKAAQLNDSASRQGIIDRFAVQGIGADRITLEGGEPRAAYLAAYQRIDIALDPFPFTGATTSAECLWMGVPVLTLAGPRFVSRQGVGLLMNAGLPEWIATDTNDYVAKAVAHASDLQGLVALRERLRQQVLMSPIFDAARFAGHLEAALRGMWAEWCERQSPGAG
jgi:predicted O-linked N-acetylglucosamine transferase (SPINDLY family)